MAKAVCYKVSQELLAIIPQLNDYLCPVCFNLAFKPIRLRCGHIFCIRCLVVMQRARDELCPLCRGSVVMQADSGMLDGRNAFVCLINKGHRKPRPCHDEFSYKIFPKRGQGEAEK